MPARSSAELEASEFQLPDPAAPKSEEAPQDSSAAGSEVFSEALSDSAPPEDAGLFAAAGPFEQFPGAVLLAGRGPRILGATGAGKALADYLASGRGHDLADAIAVALSGKAAQINPLLLSAPGPKGETGQAFDLVVLPWITGDTALVIARDITLERSLRAALIESRQRYKDLVEASGDFAWETDAEGRFAFVSPHGAVGYAAGQLVGQPADAILMDGDSLAASPFATRTLLERFEVWVQSANGEPACLSAVAVPLVGPDGTWHGARGVCREITDERARQAELARSRHREALLGYILRIVRDELEPASMLKAAAGALVPALSARGVAIYRQPENGKPVRVAQSGRLPAVRALKPLLTRVLAGEDEVKTVEEQGLLLIKATYCQGELNGAFCLWREDAEFHHDEENAVLMTEIAAQIGVANEQLGREQQLEKRSSTDPLTGLLNRRGFMDSLTERFSRAAGRDQPGALFYIDLDNFKAVNDLHGHDAGDRVLTELAGLVRRGVRKGDLAARLGGDEFALFLAGIDGSAAARKADALLASTEALKEHSASPDKPLGFSIGVALYDPADGESLEDMITRADKAMYCAKRAGKGQVSIAEPALGSDTGSALGSDESVELDEGES